MICERTGLPRRTPVRCAIYTRRSVDQKHDLSSCQIQFDVCRAFVQSQKGRGWVPLDWGFDDDGYSGATLDRPALQGLLKLIRCVAVDRIVVQRLDRLSRSLRDFVFLAQEFRANNVEMNVLAAPTLGVAALDNLMLSVLASFAEFEREMTATRIAEARAYLKSKGRRIAGAVPFGYAADPRTKQLVVVPEEGEIVSTMFRWAAAKVRPSTIASYANGMGYRTRSGNPWTARQVLFTLTNYVYAGLVVDGYGFRDGCHEALIERSVYHEVQNILALRRTRTPGRTIEHLPWLLLGLAYCGRCHRPLSTHTRRRGSLIYRYYRCRSTAGGTEPCKGVLVSAGVIEMAVLSAVGLEKTELSSKEEEAAVREAIRRVVFSPETGRIKIQLQPGADAAEDLERQVSGRV